MTYLIPTKKRSTFGAFSSKVALILFIVLLLISIIFFSTLSSLVLNTVSLIRNIFPASSFVFNFFESRGALIAENSNLKNEILDLTSINADRQALEDENMRLKELLGRNDIKTKKMGVVLSRPSFSLYDTLVIDIGKNHGVKVFDKVFFNNLIIGEVVEVGSNISKISLFSSSGKIFKAIIGDEKFEAEVKGVGGGGFEALLPKGIVVTEGDPIIFADISPKVFGLVSAVEADPADAFQKIYFSMPINIYEISEVLVAI